MSIGNASAKVASATEASVKDASANSHSVVKKEASAKDASAKTQGVVKNEVQNYLRQLVGICVHCKLDCISSGRGFLHGQFGSLHMDCHPLVFHSGPCDPWNEDPDDIVVCKKHK